jgi:hypothetical protein
MDRFRVPRREQPVRFVLDDGRTVDAEMFAAVTGPDGLPGRVLDRLNDASEEFLPVRAGSDRFLLAKSGIVAVEVEGSPSEVTGLEPGAGHPVAVRVGLAGGTGLVGRLLLAMPPERSRVVDFLNAAGRFFPLFGERRATLVQTRFVVSVREIDAGD